MNYLFESGKEDQLLNELDFLRKDQSALEELEIYIDFSKKNKIQLYLDYSIINKLYYRVISIELRVKDLLDINISKITPPPSSFTEEEKKGINELKLSNKY